MDIKDILNDEMTQEVLLEFGLENASDDAKARLLAGLGENIMGRIMIEVLKVLPEARRAEFDDLVGRGDPEALEKFIFPYIPNFDLFVQQEAKKEIDRTKEYMRQDTKVAAT